MGELTPRQCIMREILLQAEKEPDLKFGPFDTPEQVEAAYEKLVDADAHWDYESDFRSGDCKTNITPDGSRHYESKSVAMKLADGRWLGWTYWYGGGKHGEPGSVPWMEDAYFLECVEEEKVVTVRTFTKV